MIRFIKKRTYLVIFSFLLLLNVLLALVMQIANTQLVQYRLSNNPTLYLFIKAMGRLLIVGCLCLPVLKKLNLWNGCSLLSVNGIKKGILQAWILMLPFGVFGFEELSAEKYYFAGWIALGTAILLSFSIGIMEELVFRGLILQLLISKWNGKSINRAIIISSIIFGAQHMVNISYNSIINVLIQVLYATLCGILFAIIFLGSGNIWSSIIVHSIIDLPVFISYIVIPFGKYKDFGWISQSVSVLVQVPLLIWVIWKLKRRSCFG